MTVSQSSTKRWRSTIQRRQSGRHSYGVRRGASAVEFAFVAPFMFALLLGMMEFGRMLTVHNILTTAARVGVREAVLPGATSESVTSAATSVTSTSAMPIGTVSVSC